MSENQFFSIGLDGRLKRVLTLEELRSTLQEGGAWLEFYDISKEGGFK